VLTNTPLLIDDDVQFGNNNVNEEPPEEFEEDDDPEDPDVPIGRRNAAAVIARGRQIRWEVVQELERRRNQ